MPGLAVPQCLSWVCALFWWGAAALDTDDTMCAWLQTQIKASLPQTSGMAKGCLLSGSISLLWPCPRRSGPPRARVSLSAVAEYAAGATSKKMIVGRVPGVISGLTQKRSVSAFRFIFSASVVPSRSFQSSCDLWLCWDPAVAETSAAPEVLCIVLPSSVSFSYFMLIM